MSDHPVHGARILLERTGHPATEPAVSGDSGVTRYQAAILLPGARFDFTVDYGADQIPQSELNRLFESALARRHRS